MLWQPLPLAAAVQGSVVELVERSFAYYPERRRWEEQRQLVAAQVFLLQLVAARCRVSEGLRPQAQSSWEQGREAPRRLAPG